MTLWVEELGDDEWLTQYISDPLEERPRDRPRETDQNELSMIRGVLSPAEARRKVRRGEPTVGDGARYVQVSALRAEGFLVEHTPTPRNPDHVSVTHPFFWGDREASTFVNAFKRTTWHPDQ